jgi:hypothetical protein
MDPVTARPSADEAAAPALQAPQLTPDEIVDEPVQAPPLPPVDLGRFDRMLADVYQQLDAAMIRIAERQEPT